MLSIHDHFNFYISAPVIPLQQEVSLDYLQTSIARRLALLIQACQITSKHRHLSTKNIQEYWKENLSTDAHVMHDHFSYLALLNVLVKSPVVGQVRTDIRNAWLKAETALAQLRLKLCDYSIIKRTLLRYYKTSIEEVKDVASINMMRDWSDGKHSGPFYKMPFEIAFKLLKNRNCIMKKGFAYVHHSTFITLSYSLMNYHLFKEHLEDATKRFVVLHELETDSRLNSLHAHISNSLSKLQMLQTSPSILHPITSSITDLKSIIKYSPPCMKAMYRKSIDVDHNNKRWRLNNQERLVYGQFLLALGLHSDQIMQTWRPKMDIVYEQNAPYETKQIANSLRWLEKRTFAPFRCEYLMGNGLCTLVTTDHLTPGQANTRCSQKCTTQSTASSSSYSRIRSPYEYTYKQTTLVKK